MYGSILTEKLIPKTNHSDDVSVAEHNRACLKGLKLFTNSDGKMFIFE